MATDVFILNKVPLPSVVWTDQETPRWRQTVHGRNSNAQSEALLRSYIPLLYRTAWCGRTRGNRGHDTTATNSGRLWNQPGQ